MNRNELCLTLAIGIYGICTSIIAQPTTPTTTTTPATTKTWAAEPDSYRGVKFGTQLEVAREKAGLSNPGTLARPSGAKTTCFGDNRIADLRIMETWAFDESDTLMSVRLSFESAGYETLRDVFVDKFGKPHSARTETVQNGLGAKFENEQLDWHGVGVHVQLQRFDGGLKRGSTLFIRADKYEEARKRAEREKAKAKDAF